MGFAGFPFWHYGYAFEGGLTFDVRHTQTNALANDPARPLQRFHHFMPTLLRACGGSLVGKRVLDMGCNSGFWSIQCALLGAAEVVGFDAREELVAQADLLRSFVGVRNVRFMQLDYWNANESRLGGLFDVVLHLGLLYHLPNPLSALQLAKSVCSNLLIIDTAIERSRRPIVAMKWEQPQDIRDAYQAGMVAYPSAAGLELMLRHIGCRDWERIPLRSADMPGDYLTGGRATWLART